MYDYDNDEDTAGYDCKYDGGESEARKEWARDDLEEFSQPDKEAFIEAVKNHNEKYGIRKLHPKPKSEPRDLADGLREYIEAKAGRPFPDHCDENDDDVDVKKLYKELRARADKELDEESKDPAFWEEVFKDANEISSRTPMYDFGLGKMSNEQAMLDFYGFKIVQRIWREISEANNLPNHVREVGQISTKLWQELKDVRAGRIPNPKLATKKKNAGKRTADPSNSDEKKSESSTQPKKKEPKKVEVVQRERQKGDDYYMRRERGVIRNKSYRELLKGPGTVYEWIWANLVRSEWIDTKGYPIKEKYYDKGLLAYCSSYRKIAKECGLHKNKVQEYIDDFKEAGIIKVEHLIPEGKKRGQSVFILGEWKEVNGKAIERYFIDEIFLSEKIGQILTN